MGSKPNCNNCVKVAWTCEWPLPRKVRCCKHYIRVKMKCTIRGAPQSVKPAQAVMEEDTVLYPTGLWQDTDHMH